VSMYGELKQLSLNESNPAVKSAVISELKIMTDSDMDAEMSAARTILLNTSNSVKARIDALNIIGKILRRIL